MRYRFLVCMTVGFSLLASGCGRQDQTVDVSSPGGLVAVEDEAVPLSGSMSEISEVKDAVSLSEAFDGSLGNYHCDGTLYLDLKTEVMGSEVSVPVSMDIGFDLADAYGHGVLSSRYSVPGSGERAAVSDVYSVYEDENAWLYRGADGSFVKTEGTHGGVLGFADVRRLDPDVLASCSYEKTDDGYLLTGSLGMFSSQGDEMLSDLMNFGTAVFGSEVSQEQRDSFLDGMRRSKVCIMFDRQLRVSEISFSGGSYRGTVGSGEGMHEISAEFSGSYAFSGFGSVDETDARVPDEIEERAVLQ